VGLGGFAAGAAACDGVAVSAALAAGLAGADAVGTDSVLASFCAA